MIKESKISDLVNIVLELVVLLYTKTKNESHAIGNIWERKLGNRFFNMMYRYDTTPLTPLSPWFLQ